MPELPEVETVVRGLRNILPGWRVTSVEGVIPVEIVGKSIHVVRRYGKLIILNFADGMLFIHLGMTGQLTLSRESGPYTRGRILTDQGALRFDDIRKFGKVFWALDYPKRGPDPLELSVEEFASIISRRRGGVKALLLNQDVLRGVGNIYADEILFRARIHPAAIAADLSNSRLARLHASMLAVLEEAIAAGGSSISDYISATGERGTFQEQHRVYGKAGAACPDCSRVLVRMLVSQRGTTYCEHCQRR